MTYPKKNEYFNMAMNPDRERDRRVIEILAEQSSHAKADYVKSAIIAYAERDNLMQTMQTALREVLQEESSSPLPHEQAPQKIDSAQVTDACETKEETPTHKTRQKQKAGNLFTE